MEEAGRHVGSTPPRGHGSADILHCRMPSLRPFGFADRVGSRIETSDPYRIWLECRAKRRNRRLHHAYIHRNRRRRGDHAVLCQPDRLALAVLVSRIRRGCHIWFRGERSDHHAGRRRPHLRRERRGHALRRRRSGRNLRRLGRRRYLRRERRRLPYGRDRRGQYLRRRRSRRHLRQHCAGPGHGRGVQRKPALWRRRRRRNFRKRR